MISDQVLREIAELFNGDTENFYERKSGPQLINFFNNNFGYRDMYAEGFPSRWIYTRDKLIDLINQSKIDIFFSITLGKRYLRAEKKISEVNAIELSNEIQEYINNLLVSNGLTLIKSGDGFKLIEEDDDLIFVGEGSFAIVYRRLSNGIIVKKLKDQYLINQDIKSRFRREYEITKSLNDIQGIIKVFDFDQNNQSYTMKLAERTLENFISNTDLIFNNKIKIIRQILNTMRIVHERNVVHRDISPYNILLIDGMCHISDFGLGKDLKMLHSHMTVLTNAMGHYDYCAPEQRLKLSEGSKQSDVFSLGKLINFIMKKNPNDYNHIFKSISEKATNDLPNGRFQNASELLTALNRAISYSENKNSEKEVIGKINAQKYDEDVENYINNLNPTQLCKNLDEIFRFDQALFWFIRTNDKRSLEIINNIERAYKDYCGYAFSKYDIYSEIAYEILRDDNFSFSTKEVAANILRTIAVDVNRFSSQRLIDNLMKLGIEPSIEDILSGKNIKF